MSASDLKRSLQSKLGNLATVHSVKVTPMENRKEYRLDVVATPRGETDPVLFRKFYENRRNPQGLMQSIADEIKVVRGLVEDEMEVVDLSIEPVVPVRPDGKRRRTNGGA